MQKISTLGVVLALFIATSAKADPFPAKYVRLNLAVLEYGDCYVKVEETSEPMSSATKFDGEKATISRFTNAEVLKAADGRYRLIHSFDHADPLDAIFFGARPDPERHGIGNTLWFTAVKGSGTMYWSRCHLPMIVCYDRLPISNQLGLNLNIGCLHLGRLSVNLTTSKENKTTLEASWTDFDSANKFVNNTQHIVSTEIDPANGFRQKFRLPLPNVRIDNVAQIQIGATGDNPHKAEIEHLLVEGQLYPIVGIEFKEKASVVFVSRIYAGSICEKAGLQEGDVVLSFNGQTPTTAAELENATNDVPFGQNLIFKIKRKEQDQEIKVVAE